MRGCLTLIHSRGHGRDFVLDDSDIYIGRDPSCGICINSADISRHHAVVRWVNGQHLFTDLGSTNGSCVNGALATGPVALQPGDSIELSDTVVFEYRDSAISNPIDRAGMRLVAAIAGIAVMALATYLFWPFEDSAPDPALVSAVSFAEQGIQAARRDDQIAARELLRQAAGELYTEGLLDNVPTGDLQREAMRLLQSELNVSFDLWSYYDNVLRQPPKVRSVLAPNRRCPLAEVPSSEVEFCLQNWIEYVISEIHQDVEMIPPDFHRAVGRRLLMENEFIERALIRGVPMVPMIRRELEDAKMPPLLHYVAMIESGYRNQATSAAAAAGLWQFMPGTGRQYGLRVDEIVDERRDPEKSTRAAARYLRDLAFEFGGDALLLALAGYNRGENGVRRSLKKLDDPFSDRSYWRLVERNLLPPETRDYVSRFIAAAVAGEGGLPTIEALKEAGY